MAENFDVHSVTFTVGALTGATQLPAVYIPASIGKIQILGAKAVPGAASGTSSVFELVTLSNVGTPAVNGTVASAGSVIWAAGVAAPFTISNAVVDPAATGIWLGVKQAGGTASTVTNVSFAYVLGI